MPNRAMAWSGWMRSRAGWIAAIALVVAGLVYLGVPRVRAAAQSLTGTWKATAMIRFNAVSSKLGGGSAEDFGSFRDTELAMLRSRPILKLAFAIHPEILKSALLVDRADPAAWLASKLETQVIPNTKLVNVSIDSPVWKESVAVINAVIEAYLRQARDSANESFQSRIQHLHEMRDQAHREVENCRQQLRSVGQATRNDEILEVRRGLEMQDLREIRQATRKFLAEKAAAEAVLARRKLEKAPNPLAVVSLEDQIAALSAQVVMLGRDEEKGLQILQKFERSDVGLQRPRKELERAEAREAATETELERAKWEAGSGRPPVTMISPAG